MAYKDRQQIADFHLGVTPLEGYEPHIWTEEGGTVATLNGLIEIVLDGKGKEIALFNLPAHARPTRNIMAPMKSYKDARLIIRAAVGESVCAVLVISSTGQVKLLDRLNNLENTGTVQLSLSACTFRLGD